MTQVCCNDQIGQLSIWRLDDKKNKRSIDANRSVNGGNLEATLRDDRFGSGMTLSGNPNILSEAQWDRIIGLVYQAALEPDLWSNVLLAIGEPLGANGGQLVTLAASSDTVLDNVLVMPVADEEKTQFDDLVERGEHLRANYCAVAPTMQPIYDYRHSSKDEIKRLSFYQEHAIPYGAAYYGGIVLKRDDSAFVAAAIFRDHDLGHLNGHEIAYLERLAPHLRRSVELSLQLPKRAVETGIRALFHAIKCAAVLFDDRGRVISTNAKADEILTARDGLAIRDQRLVATYGPVASSVTKEVWNAINDQTGATPHQNVRIRTPRVSDSTPYVIIVSPFVIRPELSSNRHAVAIILDPDDLSGSSVEWMKREYGLTPSEVRVADLLVHGLSVSEISVSRSCSIETVRSQLKSIMRKTGTKRQSEFLSLVLRTGGPSAF